jgi:hypothetical protein
MLTFNTSKAPTFSGCDYDDAVKIFSKNPEVDHFITTDDLLNVSTGSIKIEGEQYYLTEPMLAQLAKAFKYPVQNFNSQVPLLKQLEDLEYLNTLIDENKRSYCLRTIGNIAYALYPMHRGVINPLRNSQVLEAVGKTSTNDNEIQNAIFSFNEGLLKIRIPKEVPVGLSDDSSYADTYLESYSLWNLGIQSGLRLKRTVCDNSTYMTLGETWVDSSNLIMSDVDVVKSLVDLSLENAKALPQTYEFISSDRVTPEKMADVFRISRSWMGDETFNVLDRFVERDFSSKKSFKLKTGFNDNSMYDVFNDITYNAKPLDEEKQEAASFLAGKVLDPYFQKAKQYTNASFELVDA